MDEKMTRKGFLAAAAAAGVAAFAPTVAHAAEEQGAGAETALLDELGLEVERDSEALASSEWAEMAASQTDLYKSQNGVHIMNVPAYFGFSGWDAARDQPTDAGFVYSRDGMLVRGRRMAFELDGINGDLADFVVASGTSGVWTWRKWASGAASCAGSEVRTARSGGYMGNGTYYYNYGTLAYPNGLFVSPPTVSVTLACDDATAFQSIHLLGTKSVTPSCRLLYYNDYPSVVVSGSFIAEGRWK